MADTVSPERAEQKVRGQALRRIRERMGYTQQKAAERADVSTQAWQRYEGGDRKLPDAKLAHLAAAVDASLDEVLLERAKSLGHRTGASAGLEERGAVYMLPVLGRARAGREGPQVFADEAPDRAIDYRTFFGPHSRVTQVAGDSVYPYAASGMHLVYDLDRYPRRDDGAVVLMESGEVLVKLYVRNVGDKLILKELQPEERELDPIDMKDVKGVYRVKLRLD